MVLCGVGYILLFDILVALLKSMCTNLYFAVSFDIG